MPRVKQQSDEAVLSAVLRAMYRQGPGEFTLALAAAEAGVAPATLIQRFGDKRGLILRAAAQDNASFIAYLREPATATGVDAVIALFKAMTLGFDDEHTLADQLLWLREDFRDPDFNALARARFVALRAAIAERLPPMPIAHDVAAGLVEAQWQGALIQWGFHPVGHLVDYVEAALRAWFRLVLNGGADMESFSP